MGNSSGTVITTDLLMQKVGGVKSSLSDRDTRLFNHAKCAIAQENAKLNNCELYLDFADQVGILVQTNRNPSGRIYVGFDADFKPKYYWEKCGFWRIVRKFFIDSFNSLLKALSDPATAIGAAGVIQAITF